MADKSDRVAAWADKPYEPVQLSLPNGVAGEMHLKNQMDYIAIQSFHTRKAMERIADVLEARLKP